MDDDSKFWLRMWQSALLFIIVLTLILTVNSQQWHRKYGDALINSPNPMALRCALEVPLSKENVVQWELCKLAVRP